MANLFEEKHNTFWHGYKVILAAGASAGIGLDAVPPVRRAIESGFETKTITLSCGKLTTGVTIPQWSSILMLRNLKSPETYFQAAFRVQSPWSIKNPNGDVIMTIERIVKELKTHALTSKQESEHIKMLVHLVGDIHQPLHVGCCDDQGGNKVKVKWFRNESNLHRVWDSDMIDDTRLSYTELAQSLNEPDAIEIAKYQKASVRDWANESMSVRKAVYAIGDGNLSFKYPYKNFSLVRERILKAGIRLAGILNEIYGK
jgi:hypothetical protein